MTAAQALRRAPALAPAEARALLAFVLALPRETLVAHPDTAVPAAAAERFAELAAQRSAGVPMAYLVGEQEFHGHRFAVTPDVLIPRPDTELLVDTALEVLAARPGAAVLELATGSGCIAIALQLARPDLRVVATDRSTAALAVAQANAARLGARVHWIAADWFAPLQGRFDLVLANPPYVAAGDPHLRALEHEPRAALTDEGDGLGALRAIIRAAPPVLAPGGVLLLEHGYDQGAAVRALMGAQGYGEVVTLRDLAGHERAVRGCRPAAGQSAG